MSTTQITAIPTGTWNVDASHSSIEFRVKHLGISTVRGAFRDFEGTLEIGDDITSSKVTGKIKAASVDTGEPKRDEHLRAPTSSTPTPTRRSPSCRRTSRSSTRTSSTSRAT